MAASGDDRIARTALPRTSTLSPHGRDVMDPSLTPKGRRRSAFPHFRIPRVLGHEFAYRPLLYVQSPFACPVPVLYPLPLRMSSSPLYIGSHVAGPVSFCMSTPRCMPSPGSCVQFPCVCPAPMCMPRPYLYVQSPFACPVHHSTYSPRLCV